MRRFVVALFATLVVSCGVDTNDGLSLAPTSTDVVGNYFMRTANGQELPYTAFFTATEQWQLQRDQIQIANDGTWKETTSYLVFLRSDGSATAKETVVSGTYSIANNQINFIMTAGGTDTFAGSVNGTQLTLLYGGKIFLYVR